jgi:hypothetical protein
VTPGALIVRALDFADLVIDAHPDLATILAMHEPNLPIDYLPGVIVALSQVEAAASRRALTAAQAAGARVPANRAERRGQRAVRRV